MSSYNISLMQGDSFDLTIQIKDSGGNPFNLSGYNVRGKVKYSYGSDDYLLDLSPSIQDDGTSGYINISLSGSQTSGLPITSAFYNVERYSQFDVVVKNILNGRFTVNPSVTIS